MQDASREKSQLDKFHEAARELGTDESEEAFDRVLKKVGSAKPALPAQSQPKASRKKEPDTPQ